MYWWVERGREAQVRRRAVAFFEKERESQCGGNVGDGGGGGLYTSGPGLPCNCAFIFHGKDGFPYSCRMAFVHSV